MSVYEEWVELHLTHLQGALYGIQAAFDRCWSTYDFKASLQYRIAEAHFKCGVHCLLALLCVHTHSLPWDPGHGACSLQRCVEAINQKCHGPGLTVFEVNHPPLLGGHARRRHHRFSWWWGVGVGVTVCARVRRSAYTGVYVRVAGMCI